MNADRIRAIRGRLGLTQAAFADRYGLALRTLQNWERGTKVSDIATVLLTLIEREPDQVASILSREPISWPPRGFLE
jgi:putative transcriptional regulator